jgi:ABC-type Mn2+/Zn2+ transport system permease subunit
MLDWLFRFALPFMVRALISAILVGSLTIVEYMLYYVEWPSSAMRLHAILPSVAISYLVGRARQPLFLVGKSCAILSSLGIGTIGKSVKIRGHCNRDHFAGMFALGIA